MTLELRCEGNLFGILSDDRKTLEVKCHRRRCGAKPGTIVLHTISLETGTTINTVRFKEPRIGKDHHGTR